MLMPQNIPFSNMKLGSDLHWLNKKRIVEESVATVHFIVTVVPCLRSSLL